MIRHCVFVKFRTDISSQDKSEIYKKLEGLRSVVPGIVDTSFGPNISPEGKSKGFDDGFTMDFTDEASRDAYLVNETHKAVGGELVSMLEGGRDGLLVFDIEV